MAHTAPQSQATTNHARLREWVAEVTALTQPDEVYWCDGSNEEYKELAQKLVDAGTFERLSDAKRPNSYLALSDPDDVARVEDRTFICSEREDDARAVPALGRDAADRRRPGCSLAVQRGEQVHRPLPGDARDLVLRLRLWRERAAGEEVLRVADRVGDGARRGVAGRAYVDPQRHLAGGRGQVHLRGVPERLREDEPGDADPHAPGLDGRDDRRRYRVDEIRPGWTAAGGQPGGGVLRCGARHRGDHQPERDRDDLAELDLHQLRQDRERRRVVGGIDGRAPRACDRLVRERLDTELRDPSRPSQRAVHHARRAVPLDRAGVGGPEGGADRRDAVRRAALERGAADPRGA